ncbi:uncharacterized protein LOC113146745 [Cyclospora cayetanensis]|uniref:orotate phosphoribosyltransferase n=1 Tax=Cyclospora cayetanensis TaxID=88456 RepID=A0A6P6RSL2_9EIME|nr:uncharacterized protein LOC113146745 [Cyclospora cayetanensis]
MSSPSVSPPRLTSAQRALLHAAHECGALLFGRFTLKSGRISPFFFDVGRFRDGRCMQLIAEAYAACIYESRIQYDVIFGPAYKGIPLATCTALVLASRYGQQAPFIYDRKEEKDHGEGGCLVGACELLTNGQHMVAINDRVGEGGSSSDSTVAGGIIPQGSSPPPLGSSSSGGSQEGRGPRVLVVDDVLTSGTALRSGIKKLQSAASRTELVALVVLLDRQEKREGKSSGSELSAAEAVGLEFNTKVLPILTFGDLLCFLDELMESEHDAGKREELLRAAIEQAGIANRARELFEDATRNRGRVLLTTSAHTNATVSPTFVLMLKAASWLVEVVGSPKAPRDPKTVGCHEGPPVQWETRAGECPSKNPLRVWRCFSAEGAI